MIEVVGQRNSHWDHTDPDPDPDPGLGPCPDERVAPHPLHFDFSFDDVTAHTINAVVYTYLYNVCMYGSVPRRSNHRIELESFYWAADRKWQPPSRSYHTLCPRDPQIQIPTDNCIAIDRRAGNKCKCTQKLASAEIIRRLARSRASKVGFLPDFLCGENRRIPLPDGQQAR